MGRHWRLMTSVASLLVLAGCSGSADLSAVHAEEQRPVKRYDVVQSLVSNDKVIVAGLQNGAVLVSSDGGHKWRRESLDSASMVGLTTCPDGTLLGIDFHKKVWHADAEAAKWTSVAMDKPRVPLTVACDVVGRWWVAGTRSQIAYSADKGASWHLTDLGEDAQITAIQFLDKDYGVATAEFGMVFVTEDGGQSWNRRTDMPNEFYPYDALYVSREHGFVSGLAGQMLVTDDGGQSWTAQKNTTGAPLYRLFELNGIPHGVGAGGVVAYLDGDTWRPVAYPDQMPVFFGAGAAVNPQKAVVAGGPGGLLRVIAAAGQ
ncbi:glycosyl hydrolase [Nitrogeniibacter mangrovi]|uniref:Glycosyl hydrolase n=2 Tax=Nitrogeniibacter mangrovi TaxID=2016596 RepID=A0A6C1BBI8_9RHOO|nr:glycosyl hydrolase [Nitrogeniibacter mangrovi]